MVIIKLIDKLRVSLFISISVYHACKLRNFFSNSNRFCISMRKSPAKLLQKKRLESNEAAVAMQLLNLRGLKKDNYQRIRVDANRLLLITRTKMVKYCRVKKQNCTC